MANTAQAKKRARQAVARRKHNTSLKSALRSAIKNVKKAIAAGDKAAALREFRLAKQAPIGAGDQGHGLNLHRAEMKRAPVRRSFNFILAIHKCRRSTFSS